MSDSARLGPGPINDHGNAEPDRIGGAALASVVTPASARRETPLCAPRSTVPAPVIFTTADQVQSLVVASPFSTRNKRRVAWGPWSAPCPPASPTAAM